MRTPRPGTGGPNIVLLQADQLGPRALGCYGNPVVRAPHLDRLGAEGVVFDRAYCNSPLCAPSRASMMSGRLPSALGAFDNAGDFPASVPTFAHHLRRAGYRTALVGRMHFVGPDQLHGFEERLTSDVYPAAYDMVPDWRPEAGRLSWYHGSGSILSAGVAAATVQRDFDEEVTFRALRYLTDRARDADSQPFLMVASFIHPHDPYEPPAEHWDRYDGVEIDLPRVPAPPLAELDPHSRRLRQMYGLDVELPEEDQVRRARRAYYASVSFIDDQVGAILARLAELGLAEDTVVVLTSDHGDLLGERGLWYKMSPFEDSARVPLILHAPGRLAPRRVGEVVSLVDLLPTLTELAGTEPPQVTDGRSLWPLASGARPEQPGRAVIEYLAEGLQAPQLTLVRGSHKLVLCPGDPDQLYDLATDPDELTDLAADPAHADLLAELTAELLQGRDLDQLRRDVLASQAERRFVVEAMAAGVPVDWDHAPTDDSATRYVRGDFWTALDRGHLDVRP